MLLFYANGLSQVFDEREIFRGVSLEVQAGERVAVVGPNGAGKTTLLRIIAGLDRPVAGELHFDRKVSTGFLTQVPDFSQGNTVEQVLSRAAARVGNGNIGEALSRFGFSGRKGSPVAELSGGEKTRLQLACLWLQRPDLLLLDEPTNHLDTEQLAWLEDFVRKYPGTVILVSHDRYFLDRTVQRILELRPDGMVSYSGGYTDYRKAKQDWFDQDLKTFFDQEKQARKLEKAIREQEQWAARGHRESREKAREAGLRMGGKEYFRAKAKKIDRRAKNTIKRLERIQEERVARPREEQTMHLSFDGRSRGGKRLLAVEGLEKAYGSKVLFRGTDFILRPGEKAALVGKNGLGKTTLLRILLGLEPAGGGTVWRSPALRPGYLEQELRGMGGERTVLEEVAMVTSDQGRARDLLADLLIEEETVYQPCISLSMGQRVRVALAKLLLGVHDLLLLDEPTNYLDLPSREKLEQALADFPGALIVVSHDRYLLDKVCGTVWALGDGKVNVFQGRYSEYMERRLSTESGGQAGATGRLETEVRLAAVAGRLALLDRNRDQEEFDRLEREYWEIQRRLR